MIAHTLHWNGWKEKSGGRPWGKTRSVYPVAVALKGEKVVEQTKKQKQRCSSIKPNNGRPPAQKRCSIRLLGDYGAREDGNNIGCNGVRGGREMSSGQGAAPRKLKAKSSVICTGVRRRKQQRKSSRECDAHLLVLNAYGWLESTSNRGWVWRRDGVVDVRKRRGIVA